ncbi:hypothetical protein ACHHYP_04584 [Achlya hypogyna]|uniref:RING-type domain-containing protein n=1 Tax=Achlya hypogyna TaxID=1202772 RepID=A0A1V9Z0P1_ACHHY|nr:hypothetical protein ACHHYP_04584 [Achlya hypogyna]
MLLASVYGRPSGPRPRERHASYVPRDARRWTIAKRCSSILAFRDSPQKLFMEHSNDDLLGQTLALLLQMPFPPKRLDPGASWVITERCDAFAALFQCIQNTKAHLYRLHDNAAHNLPSAWNTFDALIQDYIDAAGYAGKYVQYDMLLTCPVTHRRWTIAKRYSSILTFRGSLQKLLIDHGSEDLLGQTLSLLLQMPFPPKRLDPEASWVIAERCDAFAAFFQCILSTKAHLYRLHDNATHELPPAWKAFVALIQDYIDVPADMLRMTLERIATMPDEFECCICLTSFSHDELSEPGVVIRTQCAHVFHQGCITEWMAAASTCPICRHRVTAMVGLYFVS